MESRQAESPGLVCWNDRAQLLAWREQWAEIANEHLRSAGHDIRIDHRTLEAQGIGLIPGVKIGLSAERSEQPRPDPLPNSGGRSTHWDARKSSRHLNPNPLFRCQNTPHQIRHLIDNLPFWCQNIKMPNGHLNVRNHPFSNAQVHRPRT